MYKEWFVNGIFWYNFSINIHMQYRSQRRRVMALRLGFAKILRHLAALAPVPMQLHKSQYRYCSSSIPNLILEASFDGLFYDFIV
jgi:hypothetical protein